MKIVLGLTSTQFLYSTFALLLFVPPTNSTMVQSRESGTENDIDYLSFPHRRTKKDFHAQQKCIKVSHISTGSGIMIRADAAGHAYASATPLYSFDYMLTFFKRQVGKCGNACECTHCLL